MSVPAYVPTGGASCAHLGEIRDVAPSTLDGCEDCLKIGGRWVHLRECLACGHVGCCDNSPNKHATAHWNGEGHALIKSFEPGEMWAWCYADEAMLLPAE
jgi:Zn-finger in ubiquitin-hydrolases and other protein